MALHMGVVAVAAPFLALGLSRRPMDPVRWAPALLAPIPASLVELLVVWAWHAPRLHHAARSSDAGLVIEQATFLLSGLLLWCAVLGGEGRQRAGAGLFALLLTSMHMTLLGALIALAPRPLYRHHGPGLGLLPLEDQHLGGAIMLVVGGASYLLGGLWLAARLFRDHPARAVRPRPGESEVGTA
jgi:putative membrane protein